MATDTTTPVPALPERAPDRQGRSTLVGLLTVVTAIAFEALAVATVMPQTARALHGLSLYGWAFTAFLITSIVGMVVAGTWSDRAGPLPPFFSGLAVFAAGLVVAGSATSMPMFVAGRAVQGFGAGENIVALYVVIARVYDDADRPRVFSAVSAAWVLPSIVGPALAGFVAQHIGWRVVFYGLTPFVAVGAALLYPALRGLPGGPAPRADAGGKARIVTAVRLAAGVAILEVAGQNLRWWSAVVAPAGIALLVPALRRLLPAGALRLRRGLPSVTVFRGVLTGAFFGAEAFLPLDLQTVHHLSPAAAGLPLTLGAVGWFAGSWYQGHRPADRPRHPLIRTSFLLVAVGVASLVAVTFTAVTPWLAVVSWAIGGAGMGVGMATVGVLVLQLSPANEQGVNSAGLQISDAVGSTLCIGVGGVVLAAGRVAMGVGPTLRIVFVLAAVLAALGFAGAGRARTPANA